MSKLTITVEADNGAGIANLLDLALVELKRKSRRLTDYDTSMAGHQAGTMGSYVVQFTIPEVDEETFDSGDPFGFVSAGKPRAPKKVQGYEHPEGWYEDSILLIDDPAQPTLKEGQLLSYMREVRGLHIYVLLTDHGVATVARDYLQLKSSHQSA